MLEWGARPTHVFHRIQDLAFRKNRRISVSSFPTDSTTHRSPVHGLRGTHRAPSPPGRPGLGAEVPWFGPLDGPVGRVSESERLRRRLEHTRREPRGR